MRLLPILVYFFMSLLVSACDRDARMSAISDSIAHEEYERYVLVRGRHLRSAIEKLEEYGSLAFPNPELTYDFKVDALGEWTVLRFPGSESHWMFHNVVYWFLGSRDDANFADEVIGIAIASDIQASYLVYGDSESGEFDALYGITTLGGFRFVTDVSSDEYLRGGDAPWQKVMNELRSAGIENPLQNVPMPSAETVPITFYQSLDQRL